MGLDVYGKKKTLMPVYFYEKNIQAISYFTILPYTIQLTH